MGNRLLSAAIMSLLLVGTVLADSATMSPQEHFNVSHQAGVRLGVWGNMGDKPLAYSADSVNQSYFKSNIKEANFYAEGYFGFRLSRPLMLELAAGIVNRGDVNAQEAGYVYYGNLLIYPIQLRLKLYPLGGMTMKYQPYLMAGGGLYYGRNSITLSSDYYAQYREQSRTNFNFVLGAGVDYPILTQVGLDLNFSYMPINFSSGLLEAKSYNAVTVTVGVKYLYTSRKK